PRPVGAAPADRARGRRAEPDRAAVGLSLPPALPLRDGDLQPGRAAARRLWKRPSGRLPPSSERRRGDASAAAGRAPAAARRRRIPAAAGLGRRCPAGARRSASLERGRTLKTPFGRADTPSVDAAERKEILTRYMDHTRRFDRVAATRRRNVKRSGNGDTAEVIPFTGPVQQLEQEPTMREIEVLQLVSDGLVNRQTGHRLFLSNEPTKSH